MKNLIFSFLIALSTISLAEEVTSQKEVDVYKTKKILSELPQDKIKALINVKKNILNDEINFRNRFIELRSLSNLALKENNESRYKTLIEEIGLLKDEMEFIRFYRLQEIENILETEIPYFYNNETVFDYLNLI